MASREVTVNLAGLPAVTELLTKAKVEIDRLTTEVDAANAALTSVSDLLDEARTERDAARAELMARHPVLPAAAIDFRRIIAQRIDSYLDPNEPDGLLYGPDVIADDIVNAISAALNWPIALPATNWAAVENVLAGREANGNSYVRIADVRAALAHEHATAPMEDS
jgi:hypothetical protein